MYIRGGDQQAVEHSSSSALLYLSHWLYLCTYYDDVYIMIKYNKPEPQLKRGICCFSYIMCGYMELLKRRPVYPLIQLLKALCYITWGLGRIRSIATPLDRRNATTSLGGLIVSEP